MDDIKNNQVIYNRILKDGSGDSLYGLEIAKSLDIGSEFMKNAFNVRSKLENKNLTDQLKIVKEYKDNLYIQDNLGDYKQAYKDTLIDLELEILELIFVEFPGR